MLESTFNFSLFQHGKFSYYSCSFNPSHSRTLSLVWSLLLLHVFEHLCEASRNPKTSEVGPGLAQDVVKETSGLTAIREPQPGFKHKTQYFLHGWGAHAWGTVPLYVLLDMLCALGSRESNKLHSAGAKNRQRWNQIAWHFLNVSSQTEN